MTPAASAGPPSPPSSLRSKLYAEINKATLDQIKAIDLPASYGTKIDTLGRQLLWLRAHDPGAKSIVFSQFTDFLSVLQDALARFGIGAASIHESGGRGVDRFRRDAAVEVFLLDAKSNCSGLNLVNATHVFLCEPLVNPAVELQAVARVHRIGQMRPTCVWMCLVQDSVEGCVYEISVGRRLAHINARRESDATEERDAVAGAAPQQAVDGPSPMRGGDETDADAAMDAADSLALQGAPVARLLDRTKTKAVVAKGALGGSGEVVAQDDLWACLFSGRPKVAGEGAATAATGVLGTEIRRFLAGEAAEARRED
jgi:E3 ubiquitin-protein ligase SHPRH